MKTQKLVALGIGVLVITWIVVPRPSVNGSDESDTRNEPTITAVSTERPGNAEDTGFTVRAARLSARNFVQNIRVRGRTQAFRSVEVKTELSGRLVGEPIPRGQRVSAGDVLCEIAVDTRQVDLDEAQSRRQQARLEYDAARDLQGQGLQSAVAVAQAKTALDSSIAALERARLALENTRVRAPFDGVVETRPIEIGDLMERGTVCATLLDDSPMLLAGLVPEQQIGKLEVGAPVTAELLTGRTVSGRVTYLARSADAQSRSYRLEAEIEPTAEPILDGITSEIYIEAAQIQAHLIPASALTLDDEGNVGVKILNADSIVGFSPVEIVGDETLSAGVWVTGLADRVTVITHGQEIVFPGQQVESDFTWASEP